MTINNLEKKLIINIGSVQDLIQEFKHIDYTIELHSMGEIIQHYDHRKNLRRNAIRFGVNMSEMACNWYNYQASKLEEKRNYISQISDG